MESFISKTNFSILPVLSVLLLWSCTSTFSGGEKKFKHAEYQHAIELLEKALTEEKHAHKRGHINYLIAESYRLSNRMNKALSYYTTAKATKYHSDQLDFHYGQALKYNEQYKEAEKAFKEYIKTGSDYELVKRTKQELKSLKDMNILSKENKHIIIKNISEINTSEAEYSPMPYKGQIVFASSRESSLIYGGTGTGFTDLFYYDPNIKSSGGSISSMGEKINEDNRHEASPTFSRDGNIMIFAKSNSNDKDETNKEVHLYMSKLEDGEWSQSEPLSFNSSKFWDGCPSLSADGRSLYFASSRTGYGGLDIFRSKLKRGQWTRPKNIGKSINTSGNEMFPYVSEDGKLFFASDGHPGLGGLDLFKATKKDKKTKIENMGAPINSIFDDFSLVLIDSKKGYFSSNRTTHDAKGDDDIYEFEDKTPDLLKIDYYLAGTSYLEKDTILNTIDTTFMQLLTNVKLQLLDRNNKLLDETTSNIRGKFKFPNKVEVGVGYTIVGEKEHYIKHSDLYVTNDNEVDIDKILKNKEESYTFHTDVTLTQNIFEVLLEDDTIGGDIGSDRKVVNLLILYDFNQWDLKPEAIRQLNQLVDFLKSEPGLHVELGAHTDVRGSNGFNMRLSKKRANSCVEYILSQGIGKNRIFAKGYGEQDLYIEGAESEAEHQLNRRTTIRLIDKADE